MSSWNCYPDRDFPTAGIINGGQGIVDAYRTGRGRIYVRARADIEDEDDRQRIVVTQLPYQVNKARLLEKIAELVKDKKLEGIRELRDESDKDGMRMVIELRRGEIADVVLNNLYQQTQLQTVFGINIVALVDGQPRLLNLKQLLDCFVRHRREVVTRRTIYDLRKARERAHILEGLAIALANIDEVIELIKRSPNPAHAKKELVGRVWAAGSVTELLSRTDESMSRPEDLEPQLGLHADGYHLSATQAQAILDLRLHRLTGLEQDKIVQEFTELLNIIQEFLDILQRPERLMGVIRDELLELKEKYGDERRTEIQDDHQHLRLEDLITEEDVVVTLSHSGYAKSQPMDAYRSQRRGGKGKMATTMKDEDFVDKLFIASTHDTLLCFSSRGKAYWLKVYELPQASRSARGKPIVNLLPLGENERITAVLPIKSFDGDGYILMATASGTVKKTPISDFSRPRTSGIIAIDLNGADSNGADSLVGVCVTDGKRQVMLFSSSGKAICFEENAVRPMGRTARGVRGIRLGADQRVIALILKEPGSSILAATERGYGKRTDVDEYPIQGRGGQGVIAIQANERNGKVIGAAAVTAEDEIMLISDRGTLVRTPAGEVSLMGRNTQGVTLIRVKDDERLVGLGRIVEDDEDVADEQG